jgi:hypothetical protein
MMMKMDDLVAVSVTYGLGGVATALLPRALLEGNTNRAVIEWAIREKQEPDSAGERVAILVGELLQSGHVFDVEEMSGGSDSLGRPVALDDIVALEPQSDEEHLGDRERSESQEALRYYLTEPYRGGEKQR